MAIDKKRLKETLVLAWPIILGQMGANLMSFTDTYFVGKIGTPELASAGIANSVFFIISILGMGTVFAVSALSSRHRGEGREDKNNDLKKAVMVVSVAAGIILTLVCWGVSYAIIYFKQAEEVNKLAPGFLRWLAASTLPLLVFIGLKSFLDGLTLTRPGMLITFVGVIINIFLNEALIWGRWGFPELGFEGSAIATLSTRVLMAVTLIIYISKAPNLAIYRRKAYGYISVQVKEIIKLGLPSGLQYFFEIGAFAGAAILMGMISKETSAAHQIAIQIAALTYMVASGIASAGTIQAGHALGAQNKPEIMASAKYVFGIVGIFMAVMAIFFMVTPHFFIGIISNDNKVEEIAVTLMVIAGLFQISDGMQCVGLGLLRGIGDTKWPTIYTLVAYWVIGIPLGYFLGFEMNMGGAGIWYALLLGLSFSAVLMIRRFYRKTALLKWHPHEKNGNP